MLRWFRKIVSGKDNLTPDIVRLLGALMGVQFILNAGWDIAVNHTEFDPSNYGKGAALLLAALGAALGIKHKSEPDP